MNSVLKKKSQSTTDILMSSEKHFSKDEICEIINTCSKAGVKTLELLELKVSFAKVSFANIYAPTIEPIHIPQEIQQTADSQAREANIKESYASKEEDLDLMLIEDPVRYEELIRLGDLEDEKT